MNNLIKIHWISFALAAFFYSHSASAGPLDTSKGTLQLSLQHDVTGPSFNGYDDFYATPASGSYPALNLLCYFPELDFPDNPKSFYDDLFLNIPSNLNDYWKTVSDGKIDMDGTVTTEWMQMPSPFSSYFDGYNGIAHDCIHQLPSSINLADFKILNIVLNSELGGHAIGGVLRFPDTLENKGVTFMPIHKHNQQAIWAHELGHTFMLNHSLSNGQIPLNYFDIMGKIPSGTSCQYSDETYGCMPIHLNAYHKYLLGWIPEGRRVITSSFNSSTRYNMDSSTSPRTVHAPLLIKIPIPNSEYEFYTLEVRHKEGQYDGNLYGSGVIVTKVKTFRSNYRGTPSPETTSLGEDAYSGNEGILRKEGEVFEDIENGIKVSVLQESSIGYMVQIDNNYDHGPVVSIFQDDFETGFENWTPDGLWSIEKETGTCGLQEAPFPSTLRVAYAGMLDSCSYDTGSSGRSTLTLSSPVTLPYKQQSSIRFDSLEKTQCFDASCNSDERIVEVSDDNGATWVRVGKSYDISEQWHTVSYNISQFGGKTILVRFVFEYDARFNNKLGWMIDDVTIDTASRIFQDDFEKGLINWKYDRYGLWNLEHETDICGSLALPYAGASGNYAYYGIDGVCNYDIGTTSGTLTLAPYLNIPLNLKTELKFSSYEETEIGCSTCPYDLRLVEVSSDKGRTWNEVARLTGRKEWTEYRVDLSAFSGKTVKVRFRFDSFDSYLNNYFGWLIDNVDVSLMPSP